MMSLLQELARDYQTAVVGFGQVFLASGVLVAIAWWLKSRLMPGQAEPTARKPRQPKSRQARTDVFKPKAQSFATPLPTIVTTNASPERLPMSAETHWQRAAEPLRLMIGHGERARDLHDQAFVRLESADYAYQRLLLDLAPFISLSPEPEATHPAPPVISTPQEHTVRLAA